MSEPFVRTLLGRSDYAIISEIVEPNTRVLDLGCGEGELLAWLAENKTRRCARRRNRQAPECNKPSRAASRFTTATSKTL